jgi:hypothetical protein
MSARSTGWVVAAAIISLGAGAALSRVIEPGVRVEKVMLATNTPALRIFPATASPHPGGKEMARTMNNGFVEARREKFWEWQPRVANA